MASPSSGWAFGGAPPTATLVTEALLHYTIFFSRGIEFFEYVEYILLCLNMLGFLMCCQ